MVWRASVATRYRFMTRRVPRMAGETSGCVSVTELAKAKPKSSLDWTQQGGMQLGGNIDTMSEIIDFVLVVTY